MLRPFAAFAAALAATEIIFPAVAESCAVELGGSDLGSVWVLVTVRVEEVRVEEVEDAVVEETVVDDSVLEVWLVCVLVGPRYVVAVSV